MESPAIDATAPDAGSIPDGGAAEPDAAEPDAAEPDASEPDAAFDAGLGPVVVDVDADPPDTLSGFRFFRYLGDGRFEYNDRVVPYEVNTPLFSDYALKERAIWIPTSTAIEFEPRDAFTFPVGSAIIKSFLVAPDLRQPEAGRRLVETRVLIRYADGWRPYPYLWREDGSDADLHLRGLTIEVPLIDPFGAMRTAQYLVPQRNQCLACHQAADRSILIIGPKARYLNRLNVYGGVAKNQLEHLTDLGMLVGLPDLATVERAFDFDSLATTGTSSLDSATLEKAARDYLDVNCAHCHNPNATQGVTSQLFLDYDSADLFRLGVCKEPGSAGSGTGGRRWDIVPGDPEASILWYRMDTEEVGAMMPLLGRSLRDEWGAGLVRGWIQNMPPMSCE